jgi:hypothetical protein
MQRLLRWFALTWAGGVYLVLLRLPMYAGMSQTIASDGSRTITSGGATLAAVNGSRIYVILGVPLVAAVLAVLPWRGRSRRIVDVTAAAVSTVFVILGQMSVGMFFVPTAVALIAVAVAKGEVARSAA